MRAYVFPLLLLLVLLLVPVAPYTGVLLWAWVTMMNPHQLAGGWISAFPVNTTVVVLLVAGLVLRREPLQPPDGLTVAIIAFMAWSVVTTMAALSPALSAARADLSIKNMVFGLVVAFTTRNRIRLQAIVWIFVLSYGYFGVKGGAFTIWTGGSGTVIGPPYSSIEDRNTLALVMLMVIPLAYFLYSTSANRAVRLGLIAAMVLNAIAILGTYSRGGMLGLSITMIYFWTKSKNKLLIALCALIIGLTCWSVLPDRWFERMSSVQQADSDNSFEGRVDAWRFALNAASSRLLGVGFSGTEDPNVFHLYLHDPVVVIDNGLAAHSIYFQVLGDHGFIGLGLYLSIIALAWRKAGQLVTRSAEASEWAADLGRMARVALASYFVAGAALSMAYDASIFCLLGILSAASRLVLKSTATERVRARPLTRASQPL